MEKIKVQIARWNKKLHRYQYQTIKAKEDICIGNVEHMMKYNDKDNLYVDLRSHRIDRVYIYKDLNQIHICTEATPKVKP